MLRLLCRILVIFNTMIKQEIDALPLWFFQNLLEYKEIQHFVSSRVGGYSDQPYNSLNLGFHVGDNPETVLKNRQRLALSVGIPRENFTFTEQVHEAKVEIITGDLRGSGVFHESTAIKATDAMVTNIPDICLMVLQADCVPFLFFDAKKKVIGVAHAGWRGTVRMVVQNTIRVFKEKFYCSPSDIFVGVGPSIGPCCYEIGTETIAEIRKASRTEGDNFLSSGYFNLWEANKVQIIQMGVPEENIEVAHMCTKCNYTQFYSYRHQNTKTGRFGAGIMLKKV
ncbi:Laccase domain protein YfiH [Candidatus Brocadiaceae bacterium B188]|nr:MAG: peptidoglycan editing factor PgeF [Candidatus Brocadia sp. BROELEC01]TWU53774.1 Laccase domain protein YfiH [Candidatus Brocadiaceae bacterium B188]